MICTAIGMILSTESLWIQCEQPSGAKKVYTPSDARPSDSMLRMKLTKQDLNEVLKNNPRLNSIRLGSGSPSLGLESPSLRLGSPNLRLGSLCAATPGFRLLFPPRIDLRPLKS